MFDLNRAARDAGPEWTDFFVEAMTEYVVNQRPPRGYVDEGAANWLIAEIERDGAAARARRSGAGRQGAGDARSTAPESLKALGARPDRGGGADRRGPDPQRPAPPNVVDEAEVALLRRIVFAAGGEGACTVGADEAEMLWRLKDACLAGDNAPGLEDPVRPGGRQSSDGL